MHTVRETLSFCEEHIAPTDMVLFTTGIRVHAGTPLERHCKDSGWFVEDDPLFEPSWYVSPELDLQELYALLVGAAAAHPNWMTNAETVLDPTRAAIMKRVFSALGWGGVFWQHLPRLFRFAGRSRRKGFERQLRALRAISTPDEVAHRRPSVVSR